MDIPLGKSWTHTIAKTYRSYALKTTNQETQIVNKVLSFTLSCSTDEVVKTMKNIDFVLVVKNYSFIASIVLYLIHRN